MRVSMKLRMIFLIVLLSFLASCQAPGVITYQKVDGKWEATSVTFNRQDVTPSEIEHLKNRLNGN